jgi:hypothetical protein
MQAAPAPAKPTFVTHYPTERPHQGVGNKLSTASANESPRGGEVVVDERLGGLAQLPLLDLTAVVDTKRLFRGYELGYRSVRSAQTRDLDSVIGGRGATNSSPNSLGGLSG